MISILYLQIIKKADNAEDKMAKILVVEDDIKLNQVVCTYLNDSGFQTKGCLNANGCLRRNV